MFRWNRPLAFCLLALTLVSCGAAEGTSSTATERPIPPIDLTVPPQTVVVAPETAIAVMTETAQPASTPAPNTNNADQQLVATYGVSGGIRGLDDRLEVSRDGTLRLFRRDTLFKEAKATPAEIDALTAALSSPDFAKLNPVYGDPKACCDMMGYTITLPGQKTIQTVDGTERPAALEQALTLLAALYQKAQAI